MGYDLENAQTVVSFGAPLLDGWGAPGRFTRLWAERAAGGRDPQLRLIQIESSFSRTAARLEVGAGSRGQGSPALAADWRACRSREHLVAAHGPMPTLTWKRPPANGLSAAEIHDLARTVAAERRQWSSPATTTL